MKLDLFVKLKNESSTILLFVGIRYRRNILCGQINNVLFYFGRCCSVVKQRLLFTYCYSSYGSVLWDLENPYVESVYTAWRKGLRRAWGLPVDTHCALLPILSNSLPVIDELAKKVCQIYPELLRQ